MRLLWHQHSNLRAAGSSPAGGFFLLLFFQILFFSWLYMGTIINKQRGAAEACLAHNQEDTGSKPVVAIRGGRALKLPLKPPCFFLLFKYFFSYPFSFWLFSLFFYKEREKTLQNKMLLRRSRNLPRGRAPLSAQNWNPFFWTRRSNSPNQKNKPINFALKAKHLLTLL